EEDHIAADDGPAVTRSLNHRTIWDQRGRRVDGHVLHVKTAIAVGKCALPARTYERAAHWRPIHLDDISDHRDYRPRDGDEIVGGFGHRSGRRLDLLPIRRNRRRPGINERPKRIAPLPLVEAEEPRLRPGGEPVAVREGQLRARTDRRPDG